MAGRGRFRKKKQDAEVEAMMSGDSEPAAEAQPEKDMEAEKVSVTSDFEKALKAVRELSDLTKSPAWQRFYSGLQKKKREIKDKFDEIEKPREIVKAQMTIKAINMIMAEVKTPVDTLMNIVASYPIYAPSLKSRAQWDENSGRVTIVENS